MRETIQRHGETAVALVCISLFFGYFSLCCFKVTWAGDFHLYVAAVHSLYDDFWDPLHETLPLPGRYSNFYSPYLVTVAGFGKLVGLSGYRALQWAGVFNLALYVAAILCFFRNHSLFKTSWFPPALFIVVSTLLQNQYFHWSSETTFRSLMTIQAYPSFFAWAIALSCFGLAARFLSSGPLWTGFAVSGLIWLVALSHPLTATWVVGIVGLQGLIALARNPRDALRRVLALYGFMLAGIAITPLWPYVDLIEVGASSVRVAHHAPFEASPLHWMLWLYVLSIPCAVLFAWTRRHAFLMLGFAATFLAHEVSQLIGIGYGSRYILFMAFFAQVAVAEVAASGPLVLVGDPEARWLALRARRTGRFVLAGFTVVVLVASVCSPAVRKARSKGVLRSPAALLRQASSHDAYYHQLDDVRGFLGAGDIVMSPDRGLNAKLPPITGARPVFVRVAFRAPDYPQRQQDVETFFALDTSKEQRDSILAKYGANRILLGPLDLELAARIERDYGPPAVRSERFVLFALDPRFSSGARFP